MLFSQKLMFCSSTYTSLFQCTSYIACVINFILQDLFGRQVCCGDNQTSCLVIPGTARKKALKLCPDQLTASLSLCRLTQCHPLIVQCLCVLWHSIIPMDVPCLCVVFCRLIYRLHLYQCVSVTLVQYVLICTTVSTTLINE